MKVFIASVSAAERSALGERVAESSGWQVVSDPAWADVVLVSSEEWARLNPAQGAGLEAPVESLTPREFEVLRLVAEGLHNREIAGRLGVTEHTVKFHLAAIFGKLGASTRTEAVRRGLSRGMIDI